MAQRQRQRILALRNDRNLTRFRVEGTATGKQLGTGSYGSVEEIVVDGLICAGKKMHEALIRADNEGAENLAIKYVQECQIMADLRHPNVALFLGLCFLDDSSLPVLVIEKLDCSLDDLLENVPNIPLALKRSMLEDVARGLLYLHKHNIIHRDLTARNVLLTPYLVAKVTDFGNSRIVDLQPDQLARTLSRLPGTLTYMPPEALEASSHYGPSLDVFSFGHLALFVGLQVFPGNLLQHNYPNPDNPDQLLGRNEVERRGNYFDQLENLLPGGNRHCLLQLMKDCLHNVPSRRPTAEQLVTSLVEMKGEVEGAYGELATVDAVRQVRTVKTLKAKRNEIEQLQVQLEAVEERHQTELHQREGEITAAKEVEMVRLREAHEADLHQKDTQLEQQMMTIQQLNTQLGEKDERLREKDERLRRREEEFQEQLQLKETQLRLKDVELQRKTADNSRLQRELQVYYQEALEQRAVQSSAEPTGRRPGVKTPLRELKLPLNLKWRRGKNMPFEMSDYPQAVVFKGKVYIGGGSASSNRERQTVMVYDPQQDSFDTLPPYPYSYRYFSMAIVNNQLVLVGGVDVQTGEVTNTLAVWNEESRKWTHPLPPMTTACYSPSVTSHNNRWLVVMAGHGDRTFLSRVEILDTTESGQWYHAAPLPQPCYRSSTVTIGNTCYLLGGYSDGGLSGKVYRVCLNDLISQAVPQPVSTSAPSTPSPWTTMTDTPLGGSTALCLNGALMTVGGSVFSTTIYHYQPSTRSWIKAGELPARRSDCACTVLPSGEVFLAGSGNYNNKQVDIASVQ